MIALLTGDDQFAIRQKLEQYKAELDPQWLEFCYHRFPASALEQAISAARTPSVSGGKRLVVVEDCNLKQWGDAQLESLQQLAQVPDSTMLVFLATNVDKRLKIYKHLIKYGQCFELSLIPPWRTDLIEEAISEATAKLNATQAKRMKLRLPKDVIEYLAEAIGNDMIRVASELRKLETYVNGQPIRLVEVQSLIPCQTQSNLQLAEAVRHGEREAVVRLIDELLARSEPVMVMVATLLTQFRTWLWVKSAILSGIKNNTEIAQICNVGNPNRLYYLRQEVATMPIKSLIQAVTKLVDLEMAIKQGYVNANSILPFLLAIVRLFQPVQSK
ncbi:MULTISPECIES: DNA polymerase III subunit delta [Trichocoleus]|uniref:DNA polymerase III subunit delta n=1 Tax=Trichocoleus desertorum GB2-A4 TaxID=2933944 RepID=A0ABV0JEZ3_9CYAN|nr:DNA polymerase III subunit delta [Trichocoleus sp. FACHB-46]MBD1862403.1 DNA polymerase III subunit delta [Trichocoleus sp. FACHB-46]